jgi:preprotein translocase subunit YajC
VYLATGSSSSSGSLWLIILVVFGGGYLLFIRSVQRKQRAKAAESQNMRTALDVGVEIVTIGGLYGKVVGMDDDSVLLEIADGVTARYDRNAIARVLTLADDPASADPDENAIEPNLVDNSDNTDMDATANSIIETKD